MDALAYTFDLFYTRPGLDPASVQRVAADRLGDLDDGEIFLEWRDQDTLILEDSEIRTAAYTQDQGFGLRGVLGAQTTYAHASALTDAALKRAGETTLALFAGRSGTRALPPASTNRQPVRPIIPNDCDLAAKIDALNAFDRKARAADPAVVQVSASIVTSFQAVRIERPDADAVADLRPLCRINLSVTLERHGKRELGSYGWGGRLALDSYMSHDQWDAGLTKALEQARRNLDAAAVPAGELPVVLGAGWPGVMLHEAVGHGLEGDFNRKGTSIYSGQIGERVAARGVTVIDDGTLPERRGSLNIDDEGTPTAENVLIEDGVLVGYMQDRHNARLMGMAATGNGRRQSYQHQPLPRMTNTFMTAGSHHLEDMIASIDDGLYATNFGGGQVDIVSGQFTFQCTQAFRIRGGKVAEPVKGATLIGNGPEVMKRVSMIGGDFALDSGVGTCGKAGQGVPVGIGQPSLKIDAMTVGGTG